MALQPGHTTSKFLESEVWKTKALVPMRKHPPAQCDVLVHSKMGQSHEIEGLKGVSDDIQTP
eukprot:scaffold180432_cov56-Cyclotella_meneghiniana.AAC.1